MRRRDALIQAAALLLLIVPAQTHKYRFTAESFTFDSKGELLQKQRIAADYAEGEPGEDVRWTHVTLASGTSLAGAYAKEEPQAFMEGFAYSPARERLFSAEFFKGFPATATQAKHLVWDTFMLQTMARDVSKAKASSPYHMPSWAIALGGTGTTKINDVQLTWVGIVDRNRLECALVHYEAFFNAIEHEVPGGRLVGRSDYWGDIFVALASGEIEYATVHEHVTGELRSASQSAPRAISIVRKGAFERAQDR